MSANPDDNINYQAKLSAESDIWGRHLQVEASGECNAWLDHPLILEHYRERGQIEGKSWEQFVRHHLGHPAARSLDLGCGSGSRSLALYRAGYSYFIEGMDLSEERIAKAETRRKICRAQGLFMVADLNTMPLIPNGYDLIFSAHSFHHFQNLEHIMEQVRSALRPGGLFVLEEYVGPTQFQWTDEQLNIVTSLLKLLPSNLRMYRWDALKELEERPSPAHVEAVSPFESIRSAEIWPLFKQYFKPVIIRCLGGTIQHLLYNGIIHNFRQEDEEASEYIRSIYEVEDALVDRGLLPSDFMLLIGAK